MLNYTTTSIQRFNGTTLDRNMFNRIIKFLCFTYQLNIYTLYSFIGFIELRCIARRLHSDVVEKRRRFILFCDGRGPTIEIKSDEEGRGVTKALKTILQYYLYG